MERGIAKAGNCVDDHKLLKSSICLLSEQFLHNGGTASKQIPVGRGAGTSNNSDKLLLAIQKKTGAREGNTTTALERAKRLDKVEKSRSRLNYGLNEMLTIVPFIDKSVSMSKTPFSLYFFTRRGGSYPQRTKRVANYNVDKAVSMSKAPFSLCLLGGGEEVIRNVESALLCQLQYFWDG